ncbi:MAG TPA: peptidylprolyl isomerase, partial [Usitatibacteraceae bacterium]|nr:peptidylprolyl isomerase [Usitatibacteraceae bacterium]
MHSTLKTLAVALVAGTFAAGAVAQEKAPPKKAPAAAASGKIVVNGVTIPQSRIEAMNKELTATGQPNTPERQQAVKEELINREVLVQAAQKRGLDKNADVAAQMDMARQAVLVRALFESEVKAKPITDADLQKQYEDFK